MKTIASLMDILPIYKVEGSNIISRQGDLTIAFEATLPEIFTLSDQEYEAIHQVLVKAIKILPAGSILHKQDWFLTSKHEADFSSEDQSFLSASSERFFNERPYLNHRCYLMITRKPTTRKAASSAVSSLMGASPVPQQSLNSQRLHEFLDSVAQFEKILSDSGIVKLRRLSQDDLTGTKEKTGLIERYCFLLDETEPAQLKDIHLKDELRIGDQICQIFSLADVDNLPSLVGSRINFDRFSTDRVKFSVGFASTLGQLLSCNHIYNQFIFIDEVHKTIKQLESKRLRLQSLANYSRENAISHDATNEFLNEAVSSQRIPIKAHFNVMIWTNDRNELKNIRTQVSSSLAQMDAVAHQETEGAPQMFWASLPGNAGDFPINDTFDTFIEQASCFFNVETNYRSSISPFGLRLCDRLSGVPLHVDISDLPMKHGYITNRNKFIVGSSGSGKSFFTNHMERSYFEQKSHNVIIDVGHSYEGLCEMVDGYYFTYRETSPIMFNPFYVADNDTLDTEKKESLKTLLLALWKKEDEVYNRSEYVALSNALQAYYENLKTNRKDPGFNSFYEFIRETFVHQLKEEKVKEKDFDVENLLYVLKPYYKGGEFDYLLNANSNLDLFNQPFIVFELDNIKDHPILFPVVTLIIMEVFISKMRKLKGVRKTILIEEAWKAIAKAGMAEYIKYLFKTVRKFYGEAIVATQDVEDIIGSPIIKQAIINNADCKIILDMNKYQNKFDQIQEVLGLTDKEKSMVLSLNKGNDRSRLYKEVFISLGGMSSKVYATEVSLEEYLTYTTEQTEKIKVREYATRYGSMRKGIAMLAQDIRDGKMKR